MDNSVRFLWRGPSEISSADLLRECGLKLADRVLWAMFAQRFQRLIFVQLYRAVRYQSQRDDVHELVADLTQEVYVRLVQNNGKMLRNFRGDTDLSVAAFLARVSSSVVADYFRRTGSMKRIQNVISIEEAREMIDTSRSRADELNIPAILSWIDMERVVANDPDQKNAQRNAIIFKLHYVDGLTAQEIAGFPGFDLTESGVETVLAKLRKRIKT